MRQPSIEQSHLRYPLNRLLGTPVAVRTLRELFGFGDPLSPTTIAERAGVTPHGVRKTLQGLREAGIVEPVGQGRSVSYRIRADHPLRGALEALFASEKTREQAIFSSLRAAAERLEPKPLALWVYGSVARGEDTPGSELEVALVAAGEEGEALAYDFHDLVKELATEQRLTISIIGLSAADLLRLSGGDGWWRGVSEHAIPLIGAPPEELPKLLRTSPPQKSPQPA
jgi:predicted nucleotidyltransferase